MGKIIIVGKSASGKTFISEKLQKGGLKLEVSYTSRAPRKDEVNGVDYNFLTKEEFEKTIKFNSFYEYAIHNGNYYGTGLSEFRESDIFVWETDGVSNMQLEDRKNSTVIYVNTPENIRIKRMKARGWSNEEIEKRKKADNEKFINFANYDLMIESNE